MLKTFSPSQFFNHLGIVAIEPSEIAGKMALSPIARGIGVTPGAKENNTTILKVSKAKLCEWKTRVLRKDGRVHPFPEQPPVEGSLSRGRYFDDRYLQS